MIEDNVSIRVKGMLYQGGRLQSSTDKRQQALDNSSREPRIGLGSEKYQYLP
jgi:hypothetical protein